MVMEPTPRGLDRGGTAAFAEAIAGYIRERRIVLAGGQYAQHPRHADDLIQPRLQSRRRVAD